MGTNSSAYQQNVNPVLATSVGLQVQPYWLIIVDLLFLQTLQRLYSLIESACKKKKKHIYIALEISILGAKRTGISPPKYSILDFILSLISVGHFTYACYLQSKCWYAQNADGWNCYNAFGYRLYNYVLPSLIAVLVESIVQLVNTYKAYKNDQKDQANQTKSKSKSRYYKWILLCLTMLMNICIFLVFIPFLVTNVVPMLIAYCWIFLAILAGLVLIYATLITVVVNSIRQCEDCGFIYCGKFFGTHCVVGIQVFGCLVLSMAYNYSQYSFYGADYTSVIWYEYQSRDTLNWYYTLTNNSELIIQNIFTAF